MAPFLICLVTCNLLYYLLTNPSHLPHLSQTNAASTPRAPRASALKDIETDRSFVKSHILNRLIPLLFLEVTKLVVLASLDSNLGLSDCPRKKDPPRVSDCRNVFLWKTSVSHFGRLSCSRIKGTAFPLNLHLE